MIIKIKKKKSGFFLNIFNNKKNIYFIFEKKINIFLKKTSKILFFFNKLYYFKNYIYNGKIKKIINHFLKYGK